MKYICWLILNSYYINHITIFNKTLVRFPKNVTFSTFFTPAPLSSRCTGCWTSELRKLVGGRPECIKHLLIPML